MKVLYLAHSFPRYPTDPVGSFVLRLAVALEELGVEVRVIAPGAADLPPTDVFEGVRVDRFRYAPAGFETLAYSGTMRQQVMESWTSRVAMVTFLAANYFTARRSRQSFPADVVHAHWWFPGGLVGSWLRRPWRAPLVTTMHGSDLRLAQASPLARRLFRHVLKASTTVTTVSQWLADGSAALVPEARPLVAPMPVLPDTFQPGGSRARDRLLFVGKLNDQKGIAHLLRALALMKAKPLLEIVVGVGSTTEETRALAGSLGVADRVHWYPLLSQAELAQRYREATALVAPFTEEGLGLVAIEAQLSETPVVAFRSGGLTDIVVDNQTGLLVPPADPVALATALDLFLSLPDQGAAWGRTGRQHALARFGPRAAAGRYLDIYQGARERVRS